MARVEIQPFTESHVDEAATLLAHRHRDHRNAMPLLDPTWEDATQCLPVVAAAIADADASGAVAVEGSEVVGYVVGSPKSDSWGANIWVESGGFAAVAPEVTRDMYAVAAQRWFDEGRTSHFVLTPTHDPELVEAWYRLGFGQQHAHAIRSSTNADNSGRDSRESKISIRRAAIADVEVLAQLDRELPLHQDLSPVFSGGGTPTLEEARQDWLESFDDDRFASFVAVSDDEVIGAATGCSLQLSSMHRGPAFVSDAGFLGFATVLPSARGLGAGRALGDAVIDWSRDAGYRTVVTDWRVTNLLSSRAWPALGFETTFLRLVRNIGKAG